MLRWGMWLFGSETISLPAPGLDAKRVILCFSGARITAREGQRLSYFCGSAERADRSPHWKVAVCR